jgi:hypothetical protein
MPQVSILLSAAAAPAFPISPDFPELGVRLLPAAEHPGGKD